MSGATSRSQPGTPSKNTTASGNNPCGSGVTLVTAITIARLGKPVPVARNVASTHGSVAATSVLLPPLLAQPLPDEIEVAGQVVVRRARLIDTAPPAVPNAPPATRSPFGSVVSALTWPLMPVPSADHRAPFQRAIPLALIPPAVVN